MFNLLTFKKACVFSAKGIAWLLYASFLEYCVHSVTMYFLREPKDESESDTVFFTEKDHDCWTHITVRNPCGETCSYSKLRKILGVMERAKVSLDVCIYSMTSYDFALEILDAYKRGVKVRVMTDSYRVKSSGSQIGYMTTGGFPIRVADSAHEMHHKFFVADGQTLVNCSFNWTMQAISGNSEDAVILKDEMMAGKFLAHFEALWNVAVPLEKMHKELIDRKIDQSHSVAGPSDS